MAKINHITIKDVTRYLETIAYLPELPTATEDSADLVSVNNTLYVKQVTNGVYSYGTIQAGGGNVPSGDGVPVFEITIPYMEFLLAINTKYPTNRDRFDGVDYIYNLTDEEVEFFASCTSFHIIRFNLDLAGTYMSSYYSSLIAAIENNALGGGYYTSSFGGGFLSSSIVGAGSTMVNEFIMVDLETKTLAWAAMPMVSSPEDLSDLETSTNTIEISAAWADHLMSGQAVQINGQYFRVPYLNADGSYMLSAYDADNDEWLHFKETAYDYETGKYTFTFDDEDHSSPYGGGTGGSSVVVNSSDEATGTLTKLTVDGVTYRVPVVEIEDLTSL